MNQKHPRSRVANNLLLDRVETEPVVVSVIEAGDFG